MGYKMRLFLIIFNLVFLISCVRLDNMMFSSATYFDGSYLDYINQKYPDLDYNYWIEDTIDLKKVEEFSYIDKNNNKIFALYFKQFEDSLTDTLILYFHGNYFNLLHYIPNIKLLYRLGYDIIAIDYSGYGKSQGEPTEENLIANIEGIVDYIIDSLNYKKVAIYGYSLGGFCSVVAEYYLETKNDSLYFCLIQEAPFSSVEDLGYTMSRYSFPTYYITNLDLSTKDYIKNIKSKILFIHGKDDNFVSWENSRYLYSVAENSILKDTLFIDRADHTSIPTILGYDNYINIVKGFLFR